MIRVLLVDDQQLVREGLRRILHPDEGFDIVGECSHGVEVSGAVERLRPDVVVMDVRMMDVDGVEATRRLRAEPDPPPVLVLTTFDDDEVLSGALRAGAAGFVLKDAPGEKLIRVGPHGRSRRRLARPGRHRASPIDLPVGVAVERRRRCRAHPGADGARTRRAASHRPRREQRRDR